MSKKKTGLKIGRYRIQPLGIAVGVLLILAILGLIVYFVLQGLGLIGNPQDQVELPTTIPLSTAKVSTTPRAVVETIVPTAAAAESPEPEEEEVEPTEAPATPTPTPTPEPTPRTATIRSLGEIIADNTVLKQAYVMVKDAEGNQTNSFDFSPMFDSAGEAMGKADYTVAFVDGSMGGKGTTNYGGKDGKYNTPPHILLALQKYGVDMVTLANDHALDCLYKGLSDTITNCVTAKIDYIGAAASQEEHDTPKIVEINGINVGFVNYTDSFNGQEKDANKDALAFGVNYFPNSDVGADVKRAREAGADVVIAYISWGKQGSEQANNSQLEIAKVLVNAGVDVIVGFNPRVLQGQKTFWLELKDKDGNVTQRTLCICSLGTFLSDSEEKNEDSGIIFEFTISEKEDGGFEIINPTYIPTYVWRYTNAVGEKQFQVLVCGDWLTNAPQGMSDEDYARLKAVWSETQAKLGTTELSVGAD